MREIRIDIPKGFSGVLASQIEQAASLAVSATLMASKSRWESLAQKSLTTTRNDYLLGLNADNSMEQPDSFTGVLTLRGKWPNMLEAGFPAFDMKTGFMGSSKVKRKDDGGWFLTIPFRHLSSKARGTAVGGAAMPDDIYSQARKLRGGKKLTGTETSYPAGQSWTGYQHKSGRYEGMKKIGKKYDKTTQYQYFTFRRVSDKSDPQSWQHPGFKGINAIEPVSLYAKRTFTQVLNRNLKEAMG